MRRGLTSFFLLITAIASARGAEGDSGLELAGRGNPQGHVIVIPAAATPSVRYAAEELQGYVKRITGIELRVSDDSAAQPERAICIGGTRFSPSAEGLGDEGFRLLAKPPHLYVVGSGVRGALYGVYTLLEDYAGVGWFTSWCETVPKAESVAVPSDLDRVERPAFEMREPMWADYSKPDFAARRKANGRTMKLGEKHGGEPLHCSARLYGHTAYQLLPPDLYFDAPPEYYALTQGERRRTGAQLCLSNPDVLRLVTDALLDQIRTEPQAEVFFFGQNDCHGYCECDRCKAIDDEEGSHAGTNIRFVNALAEAVGAQFPDKTIGTFAYQYTEKPPKLAKVRKNVLICLCSIQCDFSRPIRGNPDPTTAAFAESLVEWGTLTDRLYVWDYTTDFSDYPLVYPNVIPTLQENLRFFRDHGVKYVMSEGDWQGWSAHYGELKSYLISQWMWNPDLPVKPLLRKFLRGYYGAAAKTVGEDLSELCKLIPDPETKPLHVFQGPTSPKNLFDDAWLLASDRRWQRAEELTADDPAALVNVRMGRFAIDYTRLLRNPTAVRLWASPNQDRYGREIATVSEIAGRIKAAMESAAASGRRIRLSESDDREVRLKELFDRVAVPSPPPAGARAFRFEETAFKVGVPSWGRVEADAPASGGKALRFPGTHWQWAGNCDFGTIAFEPGFLYRIRVKLRVDRVAGACGTNDWAVTAGVYDRETKSEVSKLALRVSEVGDDYAWYDLAGDIEPRDSQFLYVAPGWFDRNLGANHPSMKSLWVDGVEFFVVKKKEVPK